MRLRERTRAEVVRRLRRLRDAYGEFPIRSRTVENDPEFFEHGRRMAREGWIGDAGAFVTDDAGRALFIRHEDAPDVWGVPGGGHEPGERLAETARREVREETGVECTITGVVLARRTEIRLATDPAGRLYMLTAIFEAAYERGDIEVGDDEVLEARWFDAPPDDVAALVADRVAAWADG